MSAEFVTIARVIKTQGRRGEVAAELHTDFPEKFSERKVLLALAEDSSRRELQVEEFWPHKGWMVLKFAGFDSIEDAEKLVGVELQILREQRAELEPGAAWISDLVGCKVAAKSPPDAESREIGTIRDVLFGAGEAPLLVVQDGKRELLIPFVEGFVHQADWEHKKLGLTLPEGMLDLDAPLSREERDLQARGDPAKRRWESGKRSR